MRKIWWPTIRSRRFEKHSFKWFQVKIYPMTGQVLFLKVLKEYFDEISGVNSIKVTSSLGTCHTINFCAQYCDKKILQYFIILRHRFQCPTKISLEKNVIYLELRVYLGQKKPVA